MEVYLAGKRLQVKPTQSIGKGGEADVYDIGQGRALKVFKPPTHPDYQGLAHEQQSARERIAAHQEKLKAFPQSLPGRVIKPQELATSGTREIVGYSMKLLKGCELLLRFGDRTFRQSGIGNQTVIEIFNDLHQTVSATHRAGVVIGDFNDLNVLVLGAEAYLIDADSFQFGKFYCQVFTERFVDPLLCDPQASSLMLHRPHNINSDWYAFAVMVMQSLLFVDPYGGVYRPQDVTKRIPQETRPLHRITVFHPEVKYPKPAIHYGVLPDELLHQFHLMFEKDQRSEFPLDLLEQMRWTKCISCGVEHARNVCPQCAQAVPAAIKSITVIRGNVTATRIFSTGGVILSAAMQEGELRWLYHENGYFKREDGKVVISGQLDPGTRFGLCGNQTLMARDRLLLALTPGELTIDRTSVDGYGTLSMFDANERFRYWISSGQLMRNSQLGLELIGEVLVGQTLFWVGPGFGFGFYRAGELSVAFVFDAEHGGINDNVQLPRFNGQLVDATCVFTRDKCWFLVAESHQGKVIHRCVLIRSDGSVEALAEGQKGDGSWLSSLRGKCAIGNFLLAATDDGIVRLEPANRRIFKTREFPDTESFVDSQCQLYAGRQGLFVVNRHEIRMLSISS